MIRDSDTRCPQCNTDLRAASTAGSPDRPAHLAMLEGGAPPPIPTKSTGSDKPKQRLVSRAGPAMPVTQKKMDDAVPDGTSGWMARLEAAKKAGLLVPEGEAPPPVSEPAPAPRAATPSHIEAKPAHLLVAELEAEEKARKEKRRAKKTEDEEPSNAIAELEIARPEARLPGRGLPKWLIVGLLVASAGGFAAFGLKRGQEVEVKAEIDPALIAKEKRLKEAVAARDRGNELALKGKSEEAIVEYTKALELKPDMAKAERGLAVAYAAKDDNEKAIKHYKRYLKLAPDAPDAKKVRGIVEKYEQAKKKKKGKK